jgi:hypothetical protein
LPKGPDLFAHTGGRGIIPISSQKLTQGCMLSAKNLAVLVHQGPGLFRVEALPYFKHEPSLEPSDMPCEIWALIDTRQLLVARRKRAQSWNCAT